MQTQTHEKPSARAKRRSTRALSDKVSKAAEARAISAPLLVSGISPGKLHTISPSRFSKLDIDPSYQRGQTAMVQELVRVLQAGGKVLDPVTLCRRPWSGNGDMLWIIDGHQRICAFQQLGIAFEAMIHDSESIEAEKTFFLSLNKRRTVGADVIVKSWTGPSARMLIAASMDPAHPLYERVHYGQGAARTMLSAALIIRGAAAATTGAISSGQIQKQLAKLDYAMQNAERRYLTEHWLRFIGMVYTNSTVHGMVAGRLGLVAYSHWVKGEDIPSATVIAKLRAIDWREALPALTVKYAPTIKTMIEKIWKP